MNNSVSYFIDPCSGHKIKVGSILLMIADRSVGLVTDLFYDNDVLSVKLLQPCGRFRIRSLEYDLKMEYLSVIYSAEDEKKLQDFYKMSFPANKQ